jgi:hypothetical protein
MPCLRMKGRSGVLRPVIGVSAPTGYSWQVALQQRLLPLCRPSLILQPWSPLAKRNSANGNCPLPSLSHRWGSSQGVSPTAALYISSV